MVPSFIYELFRCIYSINNIIADRYEYLYRYRINNKSLIKNMIACDTCIERGDSG